MRSHLRQDAQARMLGLAGAALVAAGAIAAASAAPWAADSALDQMVEAERAFARTAAERGVREAFLAFLAPNAIAVQPYGNARAQWEARPSPPPGTRTARLEWAPRTGDVAASGDLGWLTGDFRFIPPAGDPRHGCYFSVWERQVNGDWRVRLDVGVDTPGPVQFADPGFARVREATGRRVDEAARASAIADLGAADRALAADAAARTAAAAIVERLAPEARLHRHGQYPLTSRQAIEDAFRAAPPADVRFEAAVDAHAAGSGDLGWTIGRYAPKSGAGESGYYVRVWKRDGAGRWTIAADVTQPAR
jgi:ketosteroid isomerase-like protein